MKKFGFETQQDFKSHIEKHGKFFKADLYLVGCEKWEMPDGLIVAGDMHVQFSGITELPKNLVVGGSLFVNGCKKLMEIPRCISVGHRVEAEACEGLSPIPRMYNATPSPFIWIDSKRGLVCTLMGISGSKEYVISQLKMKLIADKKQLSDNIAKIEKAFKEWAEATITYEKIETNYKKNNPEKIHQLYRFDEGGNRCYYDKDGEILVGHTTIIGDVYKKPYQLLEWEKTHTKEALERYAEHGTKVHIACKELLEGNIKFNLLDSQIKREVIAFQNMLLDFGLSAKNLVIAETPLKGELAGCKYAATPDFVFSVKANREVITFTEKPITRGINKGKTKKTKSISIIEQDEIWIIDVKSNMAGKESKGFYKDSHLPQLLMQKAAFCQNLHKYKGTNIRIFNFACEIGKGANIKYTLTEWVAEGHTKVSKDVDSIGYSDKEISLLSLKMQEAVLLGHDKPKGVITVYPNGINMQEKAQVEVMPLEKYIKAFLLRTL